MHYFFLKIPIQFITFESDVSFVEMILIINYISFSKIIAIQLFHQFDFNNMCFSKNYQLHSSYQTYLQSDLIKF